MKNQKLLTVGDAKTSKGEKLGYVTAILYLAPHKISGKNLCPHASAGCADACLYTAGRGRFSNVQNARIKKARFFIEDRVNFMDQIKDEIKKLFKKHG